MCCQLGPEGVGPRKQVLLCQDRGLSCVRLVSLEKHLGTLSSSSPHRCFSQSSRILLAS